MISHLASVQHTEHGQVKEELSEEVRKKINAKPGQPVAYLLPPG